MGLRNERTTKDKPIARPKCSTKSLDYRLFRCYPRRWCCQKAIPHRCPSGPLDAKGKCFVDGTPDANGVCDHTKCLAQNEPCNSIWALSLRFTSSGGGVTRWLAEGYLVTIAEAVNQLKHLTTARVRVLMMKLRQRVKQRRTCFLQCLSQICKGAHSKMNITNWKTT